MSEIAREARFMGAVTALTMHEMQNILAIIRESAGLMGDILKVNAKVDFKHRPNMERTLEHITSHVQRGKGLLEATSRLAHSPDEDMLESCDLVVYARTVALLSERLVRLKGASVRFDAPSGTMPVAVGALCVLMTGYQAVQWAAGSGTKDGEVLMDLTHGTEYHTLNIHPPGVSLTDRAQFEQIRSHFVEGRMEWNDGVLRIFFPTRRQGQP